MSLHLDISQIVGAMGALGLAASSLVDASKILPGGGVNKIGFSLIRAAIREILGHWPGANVISEKEIIKAARANWFNGMDLEKQKNALISLIKVDLDANNAAAIAAKMGMDPVTLAAAADRARKGDLTEINTDKPVLDRFDAVLSAMLDDAYERADEKYRNQTKAWAIVPALILAIAGGLVLHDLPAKGQPNAQAPQAATDRSPNNGVTPGGDGSKPKDTPVPGAAQPAPGATKPAASADAKPNVLECSSTPAQLSIRMNLDALKASMAKPPTNKPQQDAKGDASAAGASSDKKEAAAGTAGATGGSQRQTASGDDHEASTFWGSLDMWESLLIGLLAVPLAPVSKDLSSGLATIVNILQKRSLIPA